jgi:Leucine-rich repeat (LRR) protein
MIPNKYSSLVSLKCQKNNIKYISYRLHNLKYLDIACNNIKQISEYYYNLNYLNISCTPINNIPETYTKLSILKCYNTKIRSFPFTLNKLGTILPLYYKKFHINTYIKYIHNNKIPNYIKTFINESIGVCSICLEELSNNKDPNISIIKKCNHHYHRTCLFEWFNTKINCPNCREDLFRNPVKC